MSTHETQSTQCETHAGEIFAASIRTIESISGYMQAITNFATDAIVAASAANDPELLAVIRADQETSTARAESSYDFYRKAFFAEVQRIFEPELIALNQQQSRSARDAPAAAEALPRHSDSSSGIDDTPTRTKRRAETDYSSPSDDVIVQYNRRTRPEVAEALVVADPSQRIVTITATITYDRVPSTSQPKSIKAALNNHGYNFNLPQMRFIKLVPSDDIPNERSSVPIQIGVAIRNDMDNGWSILFRFERSTIELVKNGEAVTTIVRK